MSKLLVKREEVVQMILCAMSDAVSAWESMRHEELCAVVGKIVDLGVVYEELNASPDTASVLFFPGVGAYLSESSELGNLLIALKASLETRNTEAFKQTIASITKLFDASSQATENANNTNTSISAEGKNKSPDTTSSGVVISIEVSQKTEKSMQGNNQTNNVQDLNADTTDTKPTQKEDSTDKTLWGFDLSKERQEYKAAISVKKEAKKLKEKQEKAEDIEEDSFSWENEK